MGIRSKQVQRAWWGAVIAVVGACGPVADDALSEQVAALDGKPSLYFLNLDELPHSSLLTPDCRINARLFPNFAALAKTSTWHSNHTTVATRTVMAIPSLLSGTRPLLDSNGTPLYSGERYPTNLFDTLHAADYEVHATEGNNQMCGKPGEVGRPFADGKGACVSHPKIDGSFSPFVPDIPLLDHGHTSPEGTDHVAAEAWLFENHLSGMGPSVAQAKFDYLHLILPHKPWVLLPDGTRYGHPNEIFSQPIWSSDASRWLPELARYRHLLQLGSVDARLGEWMRKIGYRPSGLHLAEWTNSVVVVTADHGENFRPGENGRHVNASNQRDLLWVPLFIKGAKQGPGQAVISRAKTSHVDLRRLVLTALGIDSGGRPPASARQAVFGATIDVVGTEGWVVPRGADVGGGRYEVASAAYRDIDDAQAPVITAGAVATSTDTGPAWAELLGSQLGQVSPVAVGLLGTKLPVTAVNAGSLGIDRLSELVGSRKGSCGWDIVVEGEVSTSLSAGKLVALTQFGVVVAVSPVQPVWDTDFYTGGRIRQNAIAAVADPFSTWVGNGWTLPAAFLLTSTGQMLGRLTVTDSNFTGNDTYPVSCSSASNTRADVAVALWNTAGRPSSWRDQGSATFSDLAGLDNPTSTSIRWMADTRISQGYSDGTFRPDADVSRRTFAIFLYRRAGSPLLALPTTSPFSDLPVDAVGFTEVYWANRNGIIGGYADGTFKPDALISRYAAGTMLRRVLKR